MPEAEANHTITGGNLYICVGVSGEWFTIKLMRYVDGPTFEYQDGSWVEDTDRVDLNERGVAQALAMADLFADVHVDKAVCSGYPRTVQTGSTILGQRDLELEVVPGLHSPGLERDP